MTMSFAGKTAVVGIGATEFSKDSGRSTLRLAIECCDAAIRDAGLRPDQIDGMVSYTVDVNDEIDVARNLGIKELRHFSRIHHSGGAACGTIHQAAMAVNSGACDYALVYRAFNERSETRFGAGVTGGSGGATPLMVEFGWSLPFGMLTPASWVAMFATRYMHEYGVTSEDFGRISVADRKHAATNPKAFFSIVVRRAMAARR
jgi:acetyl-CoA acetyltransferase